MAKYRKIGSVFKGKTGPFIALGDSKSKNEKYNFTVEIVVKDNQGKVIAEQKNGFINLNDPRKEPTRLLEANLISEDTAAEMEEKVKNLSEKLLFNLMIKSEASS